MTGLAQRTISSAAVSTQLAVLAQALPLVGVLEEREHAVRDRVARRLVAGDGEQHEEHVELELGEPLAVDLGVRGSR